LGALYQITPNIWTGLSWRAPSIQISGDGSFYQSSLDTSVSPTTTVTSRKNIDSQSKIPQKWAWGISYQVPQKWTLALDITYHGSNSFRDLNDATAGEQVAYKEVWNAALGAEYYWRKWLAIRSGIFSNLSSRPEILDNGQRQKDHIDMLGFSANLGFLLGETSITLGGYFTGGKGQTSEQINGQIMTFPKVQYIYSFLVATSYAF
jgi:long-subunit fatty acid transport protein